MTAEVGDRDHLWHLFTVVLRGDRERCAMLKEHFATPDDWFMANYDEDEDLQQLIELDHRFEAEERNIDTNMLNYGWFLVRTIMFDMDAAEIDEVIDRVFAITEDGDDAVDRADA